jgi:hypothetical protein
LRLQQRHGWEPQRKKRREARRVQRGPTPPHAKGRGQPPRRLTPDGAYCDGRKTLAVPEPPRGSRPSFLRQCPRRACVAFLAPLPSVSRRGVRPPVRQVWRGMYLRSRQKRGAAQLEAREPATGILPLMAGEQTGRAQTDWMACRLVSRSYGANLGCVIHTATTTLGHLAPCVEADGRRSFRGRDDAAIARSENAIEREFLQRSRRSLGPLRG